MEQFDNYVGSERGANDRHTELMSVLREIRDLIRNKDLGDTTSAQKANREADRLFKAKPAGCPDPTPHGIEVIIHDEPTNCSPAFLAQAIMRLNPTRVFVDTGATSKLVLQLLRDNGVAAEPLPKQTSHLSLQTQQALCPMNDRQQSSGCLELQRIGLGGQPR